MTDIASIAAFWGPQATQPRLIAQRENAVYAMELKDGRRAALRLHRPGYRSREEVLAEMDWTAALSTHGLPCPLPLRGTDGTYLPATGPLASAIAWLDGQAPTAEQTLRPVQAHRTGALLRQLHDIADAQSLPPPPGPGWTVTSLLGSNPRLGPFWDNPALDPRGRDMLRTARDALADHLPTDPLSTLGFIHADPLRENLMQTDDGLALIDFDDCGWGLRGHDLGSALIQTAEDLGASERLSALAEGYGARAHLADLSAWILLRALASCGWAVGRLPPDDPRVAAYAGRAARLAEAWLG